MRIAELLNERLIIPQLKAHTAKEVLNEMAGVISEQHGALPAIEIAAALVERENLGSTGLEEGIAIPHAKIKSLENIILAVGRSPQGIDFNAQDGKPTSLFFVLLAPDRATGQHLKALARLTKILKTEAARKQILEASDQKEIYKILTLEDLKD